MCYFIIKTFAIFTQIIEEKLQYIRDVSIGRMMYVMLNRSMYDKWEFKWNWHKKIGTGIHTITSTKMSTKILEI